MIDRELIERRVHGMACEKKDHLVSLIINVLERLPKEDTGVLLDKKNCNFFLPTDCTAEVFYLNSLTSSDDKHPGLFPVWFISLRPSLLDQPEEEQKYTIAHELAHCFLEHVVFTSDSREWELQADRQVEKWGFEAELKATKHNYLYGEGLKNRDL